MQDQHEAAEDSHAARPTTPDSDASHQNVMVTVPPLEKTVFVTWQEFHEYLNEYQQRTFQIYSVRTGTPVSTRNKRIKEKYTKRGLAVPPGELLPEEMGTYSKAVVCTHAGRPRSRATGMRSRQPSRAINCPAQITLVLRRDYSSGKCFVYVSSHTTRHNHALSDGQYRRHPMIRRITDPGVLRTVHTLQKANVEPAKILKYVREHTDKELKMKDVHNMLASFRKSPPQTLPATTNSPAPNVALQPGPSTQTSTVFERPGFSIRSAPRLPAAQAREVPTQYGKFLAAFNVGKEIAEVLAEMDPDRFAQCFAELRMFLRVAESGRVPVVTTREAFEHAQNSVMTGIPNTPIPPQSFLLAAPLTGLPSSSSGPTAAGNVEAANSLISPSQPYASGQ
ncbi:hypothetical protein JG688_00007799 [Phytophthora aleatoria]|uniref:FAR1 domain-containing protein n=1 Tax=Phytophthora aleatoria TaxID=2496075 RepID=A0A8J5IXM1_9STRA|nr:hypothetical protein JG688_00007799 [Phytophthora aleatoria]